MIALHSAQVCNYWTLPPVHHPSHHQSGQKIQWNHVFPSVNPKGN